MNFASKMTVAAAAASLALSATAANATAFVTSITVSNALPDFLQVAELQAFAGAVNVAASANGGSAIGSSTYSSISTADKAIDGVTGGNYYTDTIFHSAGSGSNEFLTVTLGGGGANISSLTIFGRTDCCSARDVYKYTLFNGTTVVGQGTLDASNGAASAAVAAVPETATWAMMLAGFGMIGFAARRRSSVKTTVRFA